MYLYHLLLQHPTSINTAAIGCFNGVAKQQQIVVGRLNFIELYQIDSESHQFVKKVSSQTFGIIHQLLSFRLTGSIQDYIAVVSDSGKIVILEYDAQKNCFVKLHQESYGRSGCRRIVPGAMLAADPMGRALATAAIERQKLVYVMNRDNNARLTISSPLEAHRQNTITQCICGLEVGFENPVFACLELDYAEFEEEDCDKISQAAQYLTYYELDLGLNHVVRKSTERLSVFCNKLIAVPGGNDGPGGVLVCGEGKLIYKNMDYQGTISCPIPKRRSDMNVEQEVIIIASASHKTKNKYLFLVQSEQGDLFKVTFQLDDEIINAINIKYFDTLPPASSMHILRSGLLFLASEFGDHHMYRIINLAESDEDQQPTFSSSQGSTKFFFTPSQLTNLQLIDTLTSLSPLIDYRLQTFAGCDTPQIVCLSGRGPNSSLRILKHGLEVQEIAVSALPGTPHSVVSLKHTSSDKFDSLIVVSFINATLVLSVKDDTIEEINDSGFLSSTPTIACGLIGKNSHIQIYPEGIRHIRSDRRISEWKVAQQQKVVHACLSNTQVVIATNISEVTYFEIDAAGQLQEYTDKLQLNDLILCMSIGKVKVGDLRSPYLAIGLSSNVVRIFSLNTKDCLQQLCLQALPDSPNSLLLSNIGLSVEENATKGNSTSQKTQQSATFSELNLFIGLRNGVLLRTTFDESLKALTDTRTRYLGTDPVKLNPIIIQNAEAIVAISSTAWIGYVFQSQFQILPISYSKSINSVSSFMSNQCPECIISICGSSMNILSCQKLGDRFHESRYNLQHTPRKMVSVPGNPNQLIIIECDHRAFTDEELKKEYQQVAKDILESAKSDAEKRIAVDVAGEVMNADKKLPREVFGEKKSKPGQWASLLRVLDLQSFETLLKIPLQQNDAAMSVAVLKFSSFNDLYVLVGCSTSLELNPRKSKGGAIYTFKLSSEFREDRQMLQLTFMHRTHVEEAVGAIHGHSGRALISIGRLVRVYDMGKKKLLIKTENRQLPNFIVDIKSVGNRVICADVQESLHYMHYNLKENVLHRYADDYEPRHVTSFCVVDFRTCAVGDKFGNVTIFRLDEDCTEAMDLDPTGFRSIWAYRGVLNG
ncbi:MAG: Splicing factor 3B subunit 3, partial [Marteilia pararefringens]